MSDVSLRPATDAEIVRVYGGNARHIVGTADGITVAYIGFQRIDGRLWGLYHPFELASIGKAAWTPLFYAFRRELHAYDEPVYVLARDEQAARLLHLLGLKPTGEVYANKKVWAWTPGSYS